MSTIINPIMYIFINKGLGMSSGKIASQAAHAAIMGTINAGEAHGIDWENAPHRTVIILEANSDLEMRNIREYLEQRDIKTSMIIDEGINEIAPHSITALATSILDKDDEEVKTKLSSFKLFRDKIKVTLEIDR